MSKLIQGIKEKYLKFLELSNEDISFLISTIEEQTIQIDNLEKYLSESNEEIQRLETELMMLR